MLVRLSSSHGAAFLQLLHALPSTADFLAELALRNLEPAQGATPLFQIGKGLQAVFGLESIQLGLGLAQLGVESRPDRVGHFALRIIGHRRIFDQRVQRVFLAQVLQEVFPSPAIKHAVGHAGRG